MGIVVDDLAAAIAFFTAPGMTRAGEAPVEGSWVDRVNGLERVQVDIVMMQTPDGRGRLELTTFRHPPLVESAPAIAPPNTLGLRSVMFAVEGLDDTAARLQGKHHLLYTALHRAERAHLGRLPDPSAAIMDSQSVKTAEESGGIRGYDAHKCVKGRKRHLLVDRLGCPSPALSLQRYP